MSADDTFIDDLLGFEEEPVAGARRRTAVGWWVRTALAAAALAAVTVVGLRLFGFSVPIPTIVAGYVALLLLRKVSASLAPPTTRRGVSRRPSGEEDGSYDFTDRDALRSAVARWDRLLTRAGTELGSAKAAHRTLVELAEERLRQRHSVTVETDPAKARALVGEPLWTYLSSPPTRNLAPRDAAAYVQSLETL
ncbi:MAG TPA: hypothetical protein VI011_24040 [Asanoa sp.]